MSPMAATTSLYTNVPPPPPLIVNSSQSSMILTPPGTSPMSSSSPRSPTPIGVTESLTEWAEQVLPSNDLSPLAQSAIRESRRNSRADFATRLARGRSPVGNRHYSQDITALSPSSSSPSPSTINHNHYDNHTNSNSNNHNRSSRDIVTPIVTIGADGTVIDITDASLLQQHKQEQASSTVVARRRGPPSEDRAAQSSAPPESPPESPIFQSSLTSLPLPPISPSPPSSQAISPDPAMAAAAAGSGIAQNKWTEVDRQRSDADLQRRLALKLNRSTMRSPSRLGRSFARSPSPPQQQPLPPSLNALTDALRQPLIVSPPISPISTYTAANELQMDVQRQAISLFRRFHSNGSGNGNGSGSGSGDRSAPSSTALRQTESAPPLARNASIGSRGSRGSNHDARGSRDGSNYNGSSRRTNSGNIIQNSNGGIGGGAGAPRRASGPPLSLSAHRNSNGNNSRHGSGNGSGSGSGSGRRLNRASFGTSHGDRDAHQNKNNNTNGMMSQNQNPVDVINDTRHYNANGNDGSGSGNGHSLLMTQFRADARIAQMGIHWLQRKKARDRRRRERLINDAIAADDSLAQRLARQHRRTFSSSLTNQHSQNQQNQPLQHQQSQQQQQQETSQQQTIPAGELRASGGLPAAAASQLSRRTSTN
jgi:hypothetical protein